jgi:hypothetical protein
LCYDTANIAPVYLPQSPSEIYTGSNFNYVEQGNEPDFLERLWAQIQAAIIRFLNSLFNWNLRPDALSGRAVVWITLTVLMVALMVAIYIFFFKKLRNSLGRADDNLISVDEAERNLSEINLDLLIENALAAKNFRLAVRFCYLKILKLLAAKQIVDYQYQKTNYEYAYQIGTRELQTPFREVSFVFDCCWYGEYEAKEQDYLFAKQKFDEISTKIL